jgi:hypothetical protein
MGRSDYALITSGLGPDKQTKSEPVDTFGTVKLSGLRSGLERTNRPLSPSSFFAK